MPPPSTTRAALLVLAAVVAAAAAVAAAPPPRSYDCPAVPLPEGVSHCDAQCQQDTGNALMQLYAGLAGESRHPLDARVWQGVPVSAACDTTCSLLPSYCSWPGVVCCFNSTDTAPRSGCTLRYSTQGQCDTGDNASHGSVWLVDVTQYGLPGQLSDSVLDALEVLTANGLQAFDLSSNNISGPIPARVGRLGANLTTLNLNFNRLTGSIPPDISRLPNLKRLFVSFNRLSGTLDGCFCTKPNSTLEVLILRANGLQGSADFRNCSKLLLLDLTDNFLVGTIPVGITNSALISLRATNNKFSSSIPDAIWKLPVLTTIDLGNNDITGSISPFCGSSFNLVNVLLGNNSLSGTIPPNLTTNSQLLTLELHNNTGLHGTFPDSRSLVGLRKLDLHNTSIQGRIPDEWGTLPYLEYVDITSTRMTCCDSQAQADDPGFPKLPRFLTFTKQYAQFDLNRAMHMMGSSAEDEVERTQPNSILCRTVRRQQLPERQWNTHGLPLTSDIINTQKWLVSPLYSWFDECTCTKFHHMQSGRYSYKGIHDWCNDSASEALGVPPGPCLDMQIFLCADDTLLQPQQKAAIVVGVVLFTLLLIALLIYASLAKASKLRRSLMLAALRLKGAPKYGRMTLVVTDIEGYSDIFRRSPEVMFAALVKHNGVLRAAKCANGGFVLEQEGDSFTVAFYDPFDAVVFCLQAQQALLAVHWPPGLDDDAGPPQSEASISSRKHSKLHARLSPLLAFGPKLKRTNTNTRSAASSMLLEPWPSSAHHMLAGLGSHSPMDATAVLFSGLRVRMGVVTGDVPSGTPIKNSSLFQLAKVVGDFGQGGQIILDDATFAAIKEDVGALGCVEAGGINHRKLSSGRSCWTGLLRLCGCARQRVAPEEAVVLDMGAFCHTPSAEEDAELPYTTSRTLDVKQPGQPDGDAAPAAGASVERSLWQRLRAHSGCSGGAGMDTPSPASSPRGPNSSLPPAAQLSRRFAASAASMGRSSGTDGATSISLRQVSSDNERGAEPGGVGRLVSFSARATRQWADLRKTLARSTSLQQPGSRRDWESVRVYQILAPRLSGRAHTWHNAMNIKQGWVQWDNSYFEAPGTTTAPLTGGGLDVLSSSNSRTLSHSAPSQHPVAACSPDASHHPPAACGGSSASQLNLAVLTGSAGLALPPMTMVFVCADNPAELVRRRRPFTPQVQTLLSRVVRDALRRLGGYLCRVQEGDLKYMVAFSSPATALEWCLTVQVAAMYLPWPRSAIMLLPSCREQVDASGRLVYRGPRLKMGVCEGVPKSILPDHEGRADYHGQSINMAARFMDKGAAGGQIACTRELAVKAMAAWAAGGSSGGSSSGSGGAAAEGAGAPTLRTYSSVTGVRPGGGSKLEHSIAEDDAGWDVTAGGAAAEPAAAGPASPRQVPAPASTAQPLLEDAAAGGGSGSGAGLLAKALRRNSSAGGKGRPWWSGRSSHPGAAVTAAPSLVSSAGSSLAEPWFSAVGSADFARQPSSTGGSGSSQPAPAAATAAGGNDGSGSSGGAPVGASRDSRPGGGASWPGSDGCALPSRKQPASHALKPQLSRTRSSAHATPSVTFQGRSAASQRLAGQLSQPQQCAPRVPPVAPSAFVLQHVVQAPMAVEVRRLGLFSFKGGPPQQEMVQVLPSHLVGRLAVDEAAAAAAGAAAAPPPLASRKGQLLQRLEGRVGEPVSIQLPALAQEYHARLPDRLSGLTGLPHVDLTASPQRAAAVGAHLPSSARTAATPARQGGGRHHDHQQQQQHAHSGATVGAAGAAAAAAAGGGGAAAWSTSAPLPTATDPLAGHALGARSSSASADGGGGAEPGHVGIVVADADADGRLPSALSSFSSKQPFAAAAAVAAGGEECNGSGSLLTRHDSFKSVDGAAAAAADGDEEMGLGLVGSPTSLRAKSDPPRMLQG